MPELKAKILGRNLAVLYGIDSDARRRHRSRELSEYVPPVHSELGKGLLTAVFDPTLA
jgi:hypothetical protein